MKSLIYEEAVRIPSFVFAGIAFSRIYRDYHCELRRKSPYLGTRSSHKVEIE